MSNLIPDDFSIDLAAQPAPPGVHPMDMGFPDLQPIPQDIPGQS